MMEYRQQKSKIDLTGCPDLVDHYIITGRLSSRKYNGQMGRDGLSVCCEEAEFPWSACWEVPDIANHLG